MLLLLVRPVFAQNLCNNPANTEAGGFSLLTPAVGCSPFNVKIQDNSGGTDVEYYYYYTGQAANQLGALAPTTALEETYFSATRPTVFTILQKGKKNGKDMYACKNITVRPNNQPLFSYNSCNNRILNVTIPDTIINDFDSYLIDWGDGSSEQVAALPFNGTKAYAVPSPSKSIKIEGIYNTPIGCASPTFQTVSMSEGGNYANIDELRINNGLASVSFDFDGLDSPYRFYERTASSAYDITSPIMEIVKGSFELPYNDSQQYCFSAFRNSGGCFESAGEVCSIPLQDIDASKNVNVLTWVAHPKGIVNTLFGSNGKIEDVTYNIVRTNEDNGNVDRIENVTSPYSDNVDCQTPYCYKIEAIITGYPKFGSSIDYTSKSISNEICIDRKDFKPPALTSAFVSVNSPGSAEISYTDNSGWNLDKEQFRLLRFDGNVFSPVDSSSSVVGFTDLDVRTADSSYCYKINYTDECGSTSEASPEFCTIHLSSADQRNVDWTTESPYADQAPVTYEVIYFEETTNNPVKETDYVFPALTFPINIDRFEEFARYQIKAIDANGVESLSNIIEVPIQASMFLPNAFTPNGDGVNDVLVVMGNTKRLVDYQFAIYNRWGEEIFRTTDLEAAWIGKVGAELAPTGYYTYKISGITNTGESIQKKGMVLLIR